MLSASNCFAQSAYKIDGVHSSIGFAVKHMMISTTRGEFTDYSGEIQFNPEDLSSFSADVVIETKSINTRNEKRDGYLIPNSDLEKNTLYEASTKKTLHPLDEKSLSRRLRRSKKFLNRG